MTSSTYGTAELQGDASPSPPKPYMSRVAKIALALIACSAAAVTVHPVTRKAAASFSMDTYSGIYTRVDSSDAKRSGGAAPGTSSGSASRAKAAAGF